MLAVWGRNPPVGIDSWDIDREPGDWKSGSAPITEAQHSYLTKLYAKAGEDAPYLDDMTKAEASERIAELREELRLDQ